MQSWPGPGQGDGDGHDQWQANFAYGNQNAQFDPDQQWAQQIPDQSAEFSHLPPHDAATHNFYDPARGNTFLPPSALHSSSPPNHGAFHLGQGGLPLEQQYVRPEQDTIDPSFTNVHPDLFAQQAKTNAHDSMSHLAHSQGHPHAHSQPYAQQQFAYVPHEPVYQQQQPHQPQQYSQSQILQQQGRQPSHSQEQHQYGAVPQQQQQQPATHGRSLAPAINGQPGQYHQNAAPVDYQQQQAFLAQGRHQQPEQQQHHHNTTQPYQATLHQQTQPAAKTPTPQPLAQAAQSPPQPTNPQHAADAQPPTTEAAAEPAPKKRKRAPKAAAEPSGTPEVLVAHDGQAEVHGKQQEIDAFAAPAPSAEDTQLLAQFAKRPKAAQVKYPSIKGVPHLAFDGSVKMPAPKSFDKLAPLVAMPARSGKSMVPELGYDLPCEIQGKFTNQYRPSPDRGGLDERRIEAKPLLDQFEASMKALGKRRPKYTEYPHAFKEQLKSDEASKNKAEKRAKKEQDGGKPIRPATRPSDLVEAAVWDTIGIVHIEPTVPRTSSLIAGRVQQAGDLFIKLRTDMNKAKLEVDQAVKDKAADADVAALKAAAEKKKEAFYRALDATVEHADDAVLDNLGGHQKLILSLINALISCIKAADFSSKLPKIVLELFTHFRMTKKIVETTNFDTVRKRFDDKGDDEVKEFIRDINAKIKKASKSEAETATGYTGTSAASRAKAAAKPAADGATAAKRVREDDADTRTVKKVAVESGGSALSKKLGQSKILSQSASKTGVGSLLPGKSRPAPKPAPKVETASVNSPPAAVTDDKVKVEGRRVSGDSTEASKAAAAAKAEPKPPAPKMAPAAPSSSALSGIASLLDSINAPKAETPPAPVKETKESDTDETADEKAKRLRKESRRKLRVSWKPESELVQVKVFLKDDEEDEGRASNMIRDAADDRSEGMVLKQRAGMEEEEDDDDVPYQPWVGPVETDLTTLSEEARNKNFVTRGGSVTFSTEEQKRIADREQRELMAIYTDPADIPPTPKSPPADTAALPTQRVGQLPSEGPKFAEIQRRWADAQQMGIQESIYAAMRRLDVKHGPTNKLDSILGRLRSTATATPPTQQPSTAQAFQPAAMSNAPLVVGRVAEENILAWLRSDKIRAWRDPNPVHGDFSRPYYHGDPAVQAAGSIVEAVAKYLAGQPYPATTPPDWMTQHEDKVREWWFGYNKEASARQRKADEERARIEAQLQAGRGNPQELAAYYAQQQEYAPYMAILQQMTGQAPAAQQSQSQMNDSQLQSILAAINQGSQQSGGQASSSGFGSNDASYQALLSQMMQGQSSQGTAAGNEWARQDTTGDDSQDEARKKKGTLPPHKPVNKALIGTKPCTFWQQGKCARGDLCTFRHD